MLRPRAYRRSSSAFTLIEVLVVIVLVAISLVSVMNALRAMGETDARARDAELLQRLAAMKMAEVGTVSDPNTMEDSGDFTDQGYSNVEWKMTVEASGADNIDQVTITATRNKVEQSLTSLIFIRPASTTTTPTGTPATGATP